MSDDMLIEQCCVCGFVHRDDRTDYRAMKSHLHWAPNPKELVHRGECVVRWSHPAHPSDYELTLHATVCAECVSRPIDWVRFEKARTKLEEKYPQYRPERNGGVGYNVSASAYFAGLQDIEKAIRPLSAQYRRYVRAWITWEPEVKEVVANDPRK